MKHTVNSSTVSNIEFPPLIKVIKNLSNIININAFSWSLFFPAFFLNVRAFAPYQSIPPLLPGPKTSIFISIHWTNACVVARDIAQHRQCTTSHVEWQRKFLIFFHSARALSGTMANAMPLCRSIVARLTLMFSRRAVSLWRSGADSQITAVSLGMIIRD